MAFQSIVLIPGINVEKSLSLNEAGMSYSNLVRFKGGLIQKLGGWTNYYSMPVSSTPVRDICAFVSLRNQTFVAQASQTNLTIISSASVLSDLTPQVVDSNVTPSFTVSSGSGSILVTDPGSSMSAYGAVRFDTPIALSNLLISGGYQVLAVDINTYLITSSTPAATTVSSGGTLPTFQTTANSATVDLILPNHSYIAGNYYQFEAPTTIAGQTLQGPYLVSAVLDSTHVQLSITAQASASAGPSAMNGGKAKIHHYMVIGPQLLAGAYGAGNYGAGAYGFGTPPPQGSGTTVSSSDWHVVSDWTALLANPRGDAIYTWAAEQSLKNAQPLVSGGAPLKCNGIFIAQPQQMVVAWGCQSFITGVLDPLLIRWSDTANFSEWRPPPFGPSSSLAGSFRIPNGAVLRGGLQAPLYMVFWTDIDCWIAQFVGYPLIWSFQHFGTGCGLVGSHAANQIAGNVFWMSPNNFFMLGTNGVQPLPCPVWDFVFHQIDQSNINKVVCAPNSAFNELNWFFPVEGGNGENSAYVKVHIEGSEYEWDFGYLGRTAWFDISAAGMPIGADTNSNIVQHETSFDGSGTAINAAVETGYFAIGDGKEYAFVDFVIPDFIWSTYNGAVPGTILITFFAADFPGDVERVYGPYSVTKSGEYLNTRLRGRLMRVRYESQDLGTFWRIGRLRYRWSADGMR